MPDSFSDRLGALQAQLRRSRSAAGAARFIVREFAPLWRETWEQAFAACPATDTATLAQLRAEWLVMRELVEGLEQWASAGPELREAIRETVEEARATLDDEGGEE